MNFDKFTDEIFSKYIFHKVAKIQLLGTKIHYTKF